MIEINNTRGGFFSSLFYVLNNCHLAEKTNDDIKINVFSPLYYDEKMGMDNSFFQYYEEPKPDKSSKYRVNFNYYHNIEMPQFYGNTPICGFILNYEMREYISFLIDKYLKLKEPLQQKINLHKEDFKDKKVLGLHVRQTDHGEHGELVNINTYIDLVNKYINNYDALYVMSDNNEDLDLLRDVYKDKIYYLKDILRTEKRNGVPVHYDTSIKDRYKLGEDIIVETMLMCECDAVLLSNSNICNFVLAYKPDIKYNIMDLKISNL